MDALQWLISVNDTLHFTRRMNFPKLDDINIAPAGLGGIQRA
jgi:hypothetical protein